MPTPSASEARALLIDPAAVARFRADLAAAGRPIPPDEVLALAVSGGPDSIAMLALAVAAYPGQVAAATYDHRTRAESTPAAQAVGATCAALGVAHTILTAPSDHAPFKHAAARAKRYAALTAWATARDASLLLTAHHADDQAETLLMRLNRGSGVAGLAGIRTARAAGPDLSIIRPLLGWRRAELRTVATASGLAFSDDPANVDPRFARTGARGFLAAQSYLDPVQLARSAAYLGEAEADLNAVTDWLWADRQVAGPAGECRLDLGTLPREVQRRLVRRALGAVAAAPLDPAANVEPLLDALRAGRAATQADVLVRPQGSVWRFRPAPPRRSR